ncbi:hypothetical protein [unidentified bacterial endosymbiont]|uniref:hypothetical protein n=1 Tax=unidentified bacterial endosymbiont TaxID=2355 RepID=UPI00209EFCF7|nr:hypothetical protein [unidentified bacterial endosymbiont]
MNVNELSTIQPLSSFLAGTQPVIFCIDEAKRAVDQTISKRLSKFAYSSLNKRSKGMVIAYLCSSGSGLTLSPNILRPHSTVAIV